MSTRIFSFLFLFILVEIYSYQAFKTVFRKKKLLRNAYIGFHVLLYLALLGTFLLLPETRGQIGMVVSTIIVGLIVPKSVIIFFLFIEDIFRVIRGVGRKISALRPATKEKPLPHPTAIPRSEFLSKAAMATASLPFIAIADGIIREKYNFRVRRLRIAIQNLPPQFEGFTITQISDIHTGSFDSKKSVKAGIELANEQDSDLLVFTGDLINNRIEEIRGYEDMLRSFYAREGVFSILGNHDYGDYYRWKSRQEKADHFQRVLEAHSQLGWNLLKNQNHIITRDGENLALIGVENWGEKRFTRYGNLSEAVTGTESAQVKILLSHDPTHWDGQVRSEQPGIQLTLSGHTHGSQIGVEIPGLIKFSPAQYLFEQWAGLYQKGDQQIYVNRGFGFIGFSGRVGITPEITVIELVRGV
ncbi:MAG: metallophosphoesterase [Bacteroidia bacterium]|nr:metallophosphoesterase [Bacteroidia bacterium]